MGEGGCKKNPEIVYSVELVQSDIKIEANVKKNILFFTISN